MINREKASTTRKQISRLKSKRYKLEAYLLRNHDMIQASLVKRFLGTSTAKREKGYWYLSRAVKGKTVLNYVKLNELEKVGRKTSEWKKYSSSLSELVKINKNIEQLLRELGDIQSEEKNKAKKKK